MRGSALQFVCEKSTCSVIAMRGSESDSAGATGLLFSMISCGSGLDL